MADQYNVEMLPGGFDSVIRLVQRSSVEKVLVLRAATLSALQKLKLKRDLSKAVAKTPAGSDQVDLGSVISWINKVQRKDTAAVAQLIALDATCTVRTS